MVSHRRRKQTLKAMCCVNHSGRQFETVDLDAYKSCIRTFVNSKLIVHKDGMVDKSACNSKFSLHHTSTSGLCNEYNHSLTLSDDESQDSWRSQYMDMKMEQETWSPSSCTVGGGQNQPVPPPILSGYNLEMILNWIMEFVIMVTYSEGLFQFAHEEEQHPGGVVGAFYIVPHLQKL